MAMYMYGPECMGRNGIGMDRSVWAEVVLVWAGVVLAGPLGIGRTTGVYGACTLPPLHARTPPHSPPIIGV